MSYPTIANFDREYITRTLTNLEGDAEYEFTNLMNALTGLIILPRQFFTQGRREKDIFDQFLSEFDFLAHLQETATYLDENDREVEIPKLASEIAFDQMTLYTLISKLRHSIAHQSLRPTRDGDSWDGVIFRCYPNNYDLQVGRWEDGYTFQIYLEYEEIMDIAKKIATIYLENID